MSNSQGANFKGISPAGSDHVAPVLRWLDPMGRR
jgi:hypothetical protein